MKIGIVGLGIIGSEWTKHAIVDGNLTSCWNRTLKSNFGEFNTELKLLPEKSDFIHICLADPEAVLSCLTQIEPFLSSKNVVIQSSTIDPDSAQRFESLVNAKGAQYLEAPFTGSLPAAKNRELIFYVGGDDDSLEYVQPYLQKLSKKIIKIGNVRQAATLKLAMNLQIASIMQALAEALKISEKAGISKETFFEAFRFNASFSGVAGLKEPKLKNEDFTPQFSTKHMAKDLRLLFQSLKEESTPFLIELQEIFKKAEQMDLGDCDFSSIIKTL